MKYKTIYADPPWSEVGGGQIVRGAQRHYSLMKTADICRLEVNGVHVKHLAEEHAHLYLWVTNNFLPDGLRVVEAWGFRYITLITWAKDKFGIGQYFRGRTEQLIFAVRGTLPYRTRPDGKRAQGQTLIEAIEATEGFGIYAERGQHSRKPEEARKVIELVSHPPYIELFARRPVAGWDVWGNETNAETPEGQLF